MDSLTLVRKTIKHAPRLTREEEIGCWRKMRAGCDASRQKLFESNVYWAVSMAKAFEKKYRGMPCSLELDDAIQAALKGLYCCLDQYDGSRCRLMTYSYWWIWKELMYAMRNNTTIHIPHYMQDRIKNAKMNKEQLSSGMRFVLSLDNPHPDFEEQFVIQDERNFFEDDFLENEKLKINMKKLPQQYFEVLYMRFWGRKTLKQVANIYGVSSERIRQIEKKAIERLRELLA